MNLAATLLSSPHRKRDDVAAPLGPRPGHGEGAVPSAGASAAHGSPGADSEPLRRAQTVLDRLADRVSDLGERLSMYERR